MDIRDAVFAVPKERIRTCNIKEGFAVIVCECGRTVWLYEDEGWEQCPCGRWLATGMNGPMEKEATPYELA